MRNSVLLQFEVLHGECTMFQNEILQYILQYIVGNMPLIIDVEDEISLAILHQELVNYLL